MIKIINIVKKFQNSTGTCKALDNISLEVPKGDFVVIHGPSGAGKSTLLLTLGGMLKPNSGTVLIGSQDLYSLSNDKRSVLRAEYIGFVFQELYQERFDKVYILFDNEPKAIKKAEKYADTLDSIGVESILLFDDVPGDPGDYSEEKAMELKASLNLL